MKIQLTLTIDLDNNLFNLNDPDERDWFFNGLLKDTDELILHSNDIGEPIGTILKIKDVLILNDSKNE